MDDLVTRLHDAKPPHHRKCLQAADEIEVLRAELARVRACLERIERFGTNWQTGPDENLERVREMARAALATWNAEAAR